MTRFTFALLASLFALSALAADDPAPQFFIERIDVRNTRHASPAIIVAETRLRENQSYSEAALREASYRVARLPFVLRAEYSLEKGSRRDAYLFVITVFETKPLFFDVDLTGNLGKFLDGSTHLNGYSDLVLGGRLFAGSRGVFHGAVGTVRPIDDGHSDDVRTIQAGYTQYDLFGSRAFATFDLSYGYGGTSGSQPSPSFSLLAGIPVTANQTLTAGVQRASWEVRGRTIFGGERMTFKGHATSGTVNWSYNTTNSPFFPTRGETLNVSAGYARTQDDGSNFALNGVRESTTKSGSIDAAKFWELSERNSVSARIQGGLSDGASDESFNYNGSTFRWAHRSESEALLFDVSHSFFDEKRTRASGDNRMNLTAGIVRSRLTYDRTDTYPGINTSDTAAHVGLWWSRRNAWGLVRIGATYTW